MIDVVVSKTFVQWRYIYIAFKQKVTGLQDEVSKAYDENLRTTKQSRVKFILSAYAVHGGACMAWAIVRNRPKSFAPSTDQLLWRFTDFFLLWPSIKRHGTLARIITLENTSYYTGHHVCIVSSDRIVVLYDFL